MNIMTFDLEEWFHILDIPFNPHAHVGPNFSYRFEKGLDLFLELLDRYRITSTFFVLGSLAQRNRHIIRKLDSSRHEIASHGFNHELIYSLHPHQYREDVRNSKKILEDITGKEVQGYRGPGFSITSKNLWAFDVIAEEGYIYDATLFPGKHGHGGIPGMPVYPFLLVTPEGHRIEEYPASLLEIAWMKFAFSGGGYFRLLPPFLLSACYRWLNSKNIPAHNYFHPRDLDPDVPRIPMPFHRRFKCYVNVEKTYSKLESLLKSIPFSSIRDWRKNGRQAYDLSMGGRFPKFARSLKSLRGYPWRVIPIAPLQSPIGASPDVRQPPPLGASPDEQDGTVHLPLSSANQTKNYEEGP